MHTGPVVNSFAFIISAKEIMLSVVLIGLFVCLSLCLHVSNITQKVIHGLQNFMEGYRVVTKID